MTLYGGKRYDIAEQLLGRSEAGDIVVEAARPKSDLWRLEIDTEVAGSPLGVTAAFHFDEGAEGHTEGRVAWLVHNRWAEELVGVLSRTDFKGLVVLVCKSIQINQKEH